jgi:hypothetical protein
MFMSPPLRIAAIRGGEKVMLYLDQATGGG